MTAISIIVPVYESRQYLSSCIESLLDQDFVLPYQIILVETASPDGSFEICEKYQKEYPEKIYHFHYDKPYSISMARNLGILHASGEYVLFVDGDDLLRKDALTKLYSYTNQDVEAIQGAHSLYYGDKEKRVAPIGKGKLTSREAVQALVVNRTFCGYCWNTLIKRSFLLKYHVYFESKITVFEDLMFIMEVFYRSNSVYFASDDTYLYRQREGSTLSSCPDLVRHHIYVLQKLYDKLENDPYTRSVLRHNRTHIKRQFKQEQKRCKCKDNHAKEIKALFSEEK